MRFYSPHILKSILNYISFSTGHCRSHDVLVDYWLLFNGLWLVGWMNEMRRSDVVTTEQERSSARLQLHLTYRHHSSEHAVRSYTAGLHTRYLAHKQHTSVHTSVRPRPLEDNGFISQPDRPTRGWSQMLTVFTVLWTLRWEFLHMLRNMDDGRFNWCRGIIVTAEWRTCLKMSLCMV